MKMVDLNGKESNWNLGKYVGKKSTNASGPHKKARELLRETWPSISILEEVVICDQMRLDFFIPMLKLAIEVQGDFHNQHTPFFHGNDKRGFYKAKGRDRNKALFCELNYIRLIYFEEKETDEEWKKKLVD